MQLSHAHVALDGTAAAAYGWSGDMSEEDALGEVLALSRADETVAEGSYVDDKMDDWWTMRLTDGRCVVMERSRGEAVGCSSY